MYGYCIFPHLVIIPEIFAADEKFQSDCIHQEDNKLPKAFTKGRINEYIFCRSFYT